MLGNCNILHTYFIPWHYNPYFWGIVITTKRCNPTAAIFSYASWWCDSLGLLGNNIRILVIPNYKCMGFGVFQVSNVITQHTLHTCVLRRITLPWKNSKVNWTKTLLTNSNKDLYPPPPPIKALSLVNTHPPLQDLPNLNALGANLRGYGII